jgi:hypothetical protein
MKTLNHNALALMFPFGGSMMNLEAALYNSAEIASSDYTGGSWSVLDVGGHTIAVPPKASYKVINAQMNEITFGTTLNYYKGTMNEVTFGAALTLMLYNRLLWKASETADGQKSLDALIERFYALKDAVLDYTGVDAGAVLGYID